MLHSKESEGRFGYLQGESGELLTLVPQRAKVHASSLERLTYLFVPLHHPFFAAALMRQQ